MHEAFVQFAGDLLAERARPIFRRMADRSGIRHRFSCLGLDDWRISSVVPARSFYQRGNFPTTGRRMEVFESAAPLLARCALDRLRVSEAERSRISHVLVTCCTGLNAPGLDFEVIDHLGLPSSTERTLVGFMGCYAAMNALKLARHIVRSEPGAIVLMLNLELCTLHFQETNNLEQLLSFLLFADGCAASLVSADPYGFELDALRAFVVPGARDLITWKIRDAGFDMFLSGKVPIQLSHSLAGIWQELGEGTPAQEIPLWAVHPGGRTVLDAAETALPLSESQIAPSRQVLENFGNMSSASVMFVMQKLMKDAKSGQRGCALAFGPGLTAETLLFHAV